MPNTCWPGGIPEFVKVDEKPIPWTSVHSLTGGWRRFIGAKWIPHSDVEKDPNYEATQRRALVCEWAQMDQDLRYKYQNEGPPSKWDAHTMHHYVPKGDRSRIFDCNCIAPLTTPENRGLWTKLRILLYEYEENLQPIVKTAGSLKSDSVTRDSTLTAENFMTWFALESANFWLMGMTVHGTVVYNWTGAILLADQYALNTGSMLLTEFQSNGQLGKGIRVTPFRLQFPWSLVTGLRKGLDEITDSNGWDDVEDPIMEHELNMKLPILEILQFASTTSLISDYQILGPRQRWVSFIEEIAPGYLELEAREGGSVGNYDQELFLKHTSTEMV